MNSSNEYNFNFRMKCPNNGKPVEYRASIIASCIIPVEEIADFLRDMTEGYHEDNADLLYDRFGGNQVIVANHHGITVKTVRGGV